jgi:flagellar motor switch protein FliG
MENKKEDFRKLSGIERAAILIMALDEENATKIFNMMEDEEIKELSSTMASLGTVNSDVVERVLNDCVDMMSTSGVVVGNYDSTERLLMKVLDKDRVESIMEDIRGPAGRTTWDKLGNVNEELLAAYLKNEYPQTISLVLSKIRPDHAARVISVFPEELGVEVIMRMLDMETVKKDVMTGIERTLRIEFMSDLGKTQRRDSHEMMAEIFNNFDRSSEAKFMNILEQKNLAAAERIRALMFTFEDLQKIDPSGIQVVLRNADKDKLTIAMKGASDTIKDLFLKNMSERAAKILKDDMEALGPVRLKDVDEAQMAIVKVAKDLAASGEIIIGGDSGDDQLVY